MQSLPIDLTAIASGAAAPQTQSTTGAAASDSFTLILATAAYSPAIDATAPVPLLPAEAGLPVDTLNALRVSGPTLLQDVHLPDGNALPNGGNDLPQLREPVQSLGSGALDALPLSIDPALAGLRDATAPIDIGLAVEPAPDPSDAQTTELTAAAETDQTDLPLSDLPQIAMTDPVGVEVGAAIVAGAAPIAGTPLQRGTIAAMPKGKPMVSDGSVVPRNGLLNETAPVPLTEKVLAPLTVRPQAAIETVVKLAEASEGLSLAATDLSTDAPLPVGAGSAGRVGESGASASAPASTQLTLAEPVGTRNWQNAMGRQLVRMVEGGVQRVELRLDPPELGPIDIQLQIRDEKAAVAFQAQHGMTRDALETALPRLREMLAEQGISLQQASVSDQSRDGRQQFGATLQDAPGSDVDQQSGDEAPGAIATRVGAGLVDVYA